MSVSRCFNFNFIDFVTYLQINFTDASFGSRWGTRFSILLSKFDNQDFDIYINNINSNCYRIDIINSILSPWPHKGMSEYLWEVEVCMFGRGKLMALGEVEIFLEILRRRKNIVSLKIL